MTRNEKTGTWSEDKEGIKHHKILVKPAEWTAPKLSQTEEEILKK